MPLPYTKEEFIREANEKLAKDPEIIALVLKDLPLSRRLEGQSVDNIMRLLIALELGVPFEVVKGKSVEDLLRSSPHVREKLILAIESRM
jgi:hypothetical protein